VEVEALESCVPIVSERSEENDISIAASPLVPFVLIKRARSGLEVERIGRARKRPPPTCGEMGPILLDAVGAGHSNGGLVDLTVGDVLLRRSTRGRWSAVADAGGLATLSRIVGSDELARNTGRIPAFGLCGYLALQWAAAGTQYVAEWADLRVERNRARLDLFLTELLVGCVCARVRRKVQLVQASIRYASSPWQLSRDSEGWLDIGDLCHLRIDFPLVVWGADMGNGHRRVRFPLSGNVPVGGFDASVLAASPGQIILDSDHFFPLDQVAHGERAGEVVEAVCTVACGLSGGFSPVTSEGAVGESCRLVTVRQRDVLEWQRNQAELQRDEAEMQITAEDAIAEAAAPTEGWLADAGTPVGLDRGATGGCTVAVRPGLWLRKRRAGVAFPDGLSRPEKRRRLDTPDWGTASDAAEEDPPE
jgi:hypothetical protein